MSNVSDFSKYLRRKQSSEVAKEIAKERKNLLLMILNRLVDIFENESMPLPLKVLKDIIDNDPEVASSVRDSGWGYIAMDFDAAPGTYHASFSSLLRDLVPEYAIQGNREFLQVEAGPYVPVEEEHVIGSETWEQHFHHWFTLRLPATNCNSIGIAIRLLQRLMAEQHVRVMEPFVDENGDFNTRMIYGESASYLIRISFLPFILDASAFGFFEEMGLGKQ